MIDKISSSGSAEPTTATLLPQSPLQESIVFLARFFGTPIQVERLRDSLAAHEQDHRHIPEDEAMSQLLGHAGLAGTPLRSGQRRRHTELPALVLGENGRCLVVLSLKDGQMECHSPGIEGTSWLDLEAIEREAPNARWLAARPQLHFDQRSLLYTLPQVGRWFWDTFQRNRWMFAWALLGTVVLNVFGALIPFYSMAVYDRVIPHNALNSLGVLTTAVVLLTGFEFTMRLLRSNLLETAARRMDVALSSKVFAQCLRMRAADRPASGGVLANTVRDFESVREFFATSTLTVLGDLPFMFLYLAVIALVGGPLVFVPLICIPILLGISFAARKPLARKVNDSMQESSQRTAHLFETMNGLDTVKALGAEAWSRRKWESLTQAIAQNSLETREITARMNYANTAVLGLAAVAVVAVGAVMMSAHSLSLGQIIAVSMLTARALSPVSQIAGLVLRWEQTKLSYAALNKIMSAPTDEAASSLQAPPLSGTLEFRDMSFAYPKQPPTVERLNIRIRAGERVGIIGKLGSGKSTLLKLILNQYAPETGAVLVDDIVTTQIEPLSLRRQIGYVPQDVTLFHGTMRENIEIGRVQGDDNALLEAMRNSCLDEIVTQLPQGVATPVGERGERLSGGQRQLVAIARALLTSPPLLLLDEPSSMVDPTTEQKLIARMRALPRTTVVLVTHRMAMLALIDRLIVMDRGRIVADGPRDEVLKALAQRPTTSDAKPAASPAPQDASNEMQVAK
ncbi:type I secretion system permease/ATPase [Variovorax sp. J22R133]|uniref:type I secretion system permease/ATPase n=1 Tax=Variovorax brevis TaxID=3053503 RepID=UPI002578179A|nr:type I secretion system permease/ATPase [Variovorax sp. J22R133]MDM0111537.1 type I secretion system permease/ATPase [Variovorax sp. J22R133]